MILLIESIDGESAASDPMILLRHLNPIHVFNEGERDTYFKNVGLITNLLEEDICYIKLLNKWKVHQVDELGNFINPVGYLRGRKIRIDYNRAVLTDRMYL